MSMQGSGRLSTRPGSTCGKRQHAARRHPGCTHNHTRACSPLVYAPVGVGPGQNLPPEQAESGQRVGGKTEARGTPEWPGGQGGGMKEDQKEQLHGVWVFCLPSGIGNKVMVSLGEGATLSEQRWTVSRFCCHGHHPRLRSPHSNLTGDFGLLTVSPAKVNTSI